VTRAGAGSPPGTRTATRHQPGRRDPARRRAAAEAARPARPARPRHWTAAERAGGAAAPGARERRPSPASAASRARARATDDPAVDGATALERAFPLRTPAERRAATSARLRVVDEAGRRRRRRLKLAAWFVGVVGVALMFGAAAFHVLLVQSQFRLEELDRQVATEQQRYEQLRLQVAELSSPAAIVQAATGQLGMVEPERTTYLVADVTAPAGTADEQDPISPEAWDEIKERLAQRP
jgi:cell division protein FtsL